MAEKKTEQQTVGVGKSEIIERVVVSNGPEPAKKQDPKPKAETGDKAEK